MHNWKRNGWLTAKKQPVKNQEDLMRLDDAMNSSAVHVKWNHVQGHAGHRGNVEADMLAVEGARIW